MPHICLCGEALQLCLTRPPTRRLHAAPPAAPLFAATVAFSAGILLQSYCYKPATLYFVCTMAFALCSLLALRFAKSGMRAVLAYSGAVLAFLPAGALFTAAHQSRPSPVATVLNYASGDEATLTGYVVRPGSLRKGRDLHESLDLAVEEAQFEGDAPHAVTGSVRLNLYVPGARSNFDWESEEDGAEDAEVPAGLRLWTTAAAASQTSAAGKLPQSGKHGLRGLAARTGSGSAWLG